MHDRPTGGEHSKLASLARLIREVDSAPDMETALRVVVERTRVLMAVDACSIYFTEHERRRHGRSHGWPCPDRGRTGSIRLWQGAHWEGGRAPCPSTWSTFPKRRIRSSSANPVPDLPWVSRRTDYPPRRGVGCIGRASAGRAPLRRCRYRDPDHPGRPTGWRDRLCEG